MSLAKTVTLTWQFMLVARSTTKAKLVTVSVVALRHRWSRHIWTAHPTDRKKAWALSTMASSATGKLTFRFLKNAFSIEAIIYPDIFKIVRLFIFSRQLEKWPFDRLVFNWFSKIVFNCTHCFFCDPKQLP